MIIIRSAQGSRKAKKEGLLSIPLQNNRYYVMGVGKCVCVWGGGGGSVLPQKQATHLFKANLRPRFVKFKTYRQYADIKERIWK